MAFRIEEAYSSVETSRVSSGMTTEYPGKERDVATRCAANARQASMLMNCLRLNALYNVLELSTKSLQGRCADDLSLATSQRANSIAMSITKTYDTDDIQRHACPVENVVAKVSPNPSRSQLPPHHSAE